MANKPNRFSPIIEIINHFDNLINRIDIDIEEAIGKYSQEQVLSELTCFEIKRRPVKSLERFFFKCFDSSESENPIENIRNPIRYQTVDEWPESMKVIDYLNRIREKTIDELTKAQEDTLSHYKLNSSHFKSNDHQNMDEIRSEMFKEKFYFQVLYKPVYRAPWIFNVYTFNTDFYMSPTDINLLEILINSSHEHEIFDKGLVIFDEKMVLIGLLQKHFFANLKNERFPSHTIISRKRDLLNIKEIDCNYHLNGVNLTDTSIDLTNLERLKLKAYKIDPIEINIQGLLSLKYLRLEFNYTKEFTFKNLPELREMHIFLYSINSDYISKLCDYLPHIETLTLNGNYFDLNLDNLKHLKALHLTGYLMDEFNFDLFENICQQLEEISIEVRNLDDKFLAKLFYGHNFPHLHKLVLRNSKITKFEKKFFDRFPILQTLSVFENMQLRNIDKDAFSNLKDLIELHLSENRIESIDKAHFGNLTKLTALTLIGHLNLLGDIDENMFSDLKFLKTLYLNNLIILEGIIVADFKKLITN